MKIEIEMDREHYDALLNQVVKESREYYLLKNSIMIRYPGMFQSTVLIVCDDQDASALLKVASQCCPQAASAIEAAMKNSRSP
jgi:hypothetical protein